MNRIIRSFSTVPIDFSRYYVLKFRYIPEAYYYACFHEKQFKNEIKALEEEKKAYLVGGNHFPLNGATIYFNCHNQEIPLTFAKKNIYQLKGIIESWTLDQAENITFKKMRDLASTYQFK